MAYGSIAPPIPTKTLPVLAYSLPSRKVLRLFPVTAATVPRGAVDYLAEVFNEELASGKSYPQEGQQTTEQFATYFFGATCIIGVVSPDEEEAVTDGTPIADDIETARAGRTWKDCIGGCYYIKPNYPGRSSHNCNGGFLIPNVFRGNKLGMTLGKSYLIYAPMLGYRGSVFNLVYKNNLASLAIWDRLGFSRVGLIPAAGRLKTGPNGEEEYVDAVVVWKSFVEQTEVTPE